MDFAFSDEQDAFREVLRRFFEERSPLIDVRKAFGSADGFDRGLWKQMAEELGLQGVHLPEEHGGQGFGFLELGIVLEEMGRALVPGPFLASSVLAAGAIMAAGTPEQQAAWLPGIASGERIGAFAIVEADGSWSPASVRTTAKVEGDKVLLGGTKHTVLCGDIADFFVVVAREPGSEGEAGLVLAVVDSSADGVSVTAQEALDLTRRQAEVTFTDAEAARLGSDRAFEAIQQTLRHGAIALGAEAIGGADRALEMAVEYAKVRHQFARPIGSFQAVKHKAAEALRDNELARAAVYWSWWVAEQDDTAQLAEAAPLAKATAADAYLGAAATNIQLHGGIGFTWEHDAHLFYKRAKSIELMLGDSVEQRAALATALGI